MSDQGKWFKLWCSALDDAELENLEIHAWFCWVRFGAYLKKHGDNGSIYLQAPCRALQATFRVTSYKEVIEMLLTFPNILLSSAVIKWPHGYAKEPLCQGAIWWGQRYAERGVSTPPEEIVKKVLSEGFVFVSLFNWNKYQADKSTKRVQAFREKRGVDETVNETRQEEKRRDKEEKRCKTSPIVPQGGADGGGGLVGVWFEKTWQAYPKERRVGKKAALRSYKRGVKTLDDARRVARALDRYLASETAKSGYIRNASTFFANWEDYEHDERGVSAGVYHSPHESGEPGKALPSGGAVDAAGVLERLADHVQFPKRLETRGD